jgi:hypothetical protein
VKRDGLNASLASDGLVKPKSMQRETFPFSVNHAAYKRLVKWQNRMMRPSKPLINKDITGPVGNGIQGF